MDKQPASLTIFIMIAGLLLAGRVSAAPVDNLVDLRGVQINLCQSSCATIRPNSSTGIPE